MTSGPPGWRWRIPSDPVRIGNAERIAFPLIQAEISRQVAAHVPQTIGQTGAIHIERLACVSLGEGRSGMHMVAAATIALSRADGLLVLRILHGRMDPARLLA
jgi:hypothetical protein